MKPVTNMIRYVSIIGVFLATASGEFQCPKPYGNFPDPNQCDLYYECFDGQPKEIMCPDGLVFDPASIRDEPCDYGLNVHCGSRTILQPAKPTEDCPRQNGIFAHPFPEVCDKYITCKDGGVLTITPCPPGLHFDERAGNCVWPQVLNKTECKGQDLVTEDGFRCPDRSSITDRGQVIAHPRYPHPEDCQKFYICLSGTEPRVHGCPKGEVYNLEREVCDAPINVPGCEDYYKDDPEFQHLSINDGDSKKTVLKD